MPGFGLIKTYRTNTICPRLSLKRPLPVLRSCGHLLCQFANSKRHRVGGLK